MTKFNLVHDTSDFFAIKAGDVIVLDGREFEVTGNEKERRFGVEDPKFWVKRVIEKESGERKLAKLTYFEDFMTSIGGAKIKCFRSPEKEGKILELIKGHPDFMQGEVFWDIKNNNIRVLDIIRGANFFVFMEQYDRMPHEKYFNEVLPCILRKLLKAFEAIKILHLNGFKHGDIRNDHIMVERKTGNYVWIDFDYDYDSPENPYSLDLFGIGNIILYAVGKGFHNLYMIKNDTYTYGDFFEKVEEGDFSLLDRSRFVNLRKLYPYIPRMLNDILLHFSKGTPIYYEFIDEILESLKGYLRSL
ncbi:MAG: protein kinase [Desulforegulaceae bacterium]|nr:protein kinase [Desulforegulaceae bacterium]